MMVDSMDTYRVKAGAPPERVDARRIRKLGSRALVAGAAGLFAGLLILWLVVGQISQNARDRGQDTNIQRIEDADPCTKLNAARTAEAAASHIKPCKDFLRGLANPEVFPHRLSCLIGQELGVADPRVCPGGARRAPDDEQRQTPPSAPQGSTVAPSSTAPAEPPASPSPSGEVPSGPAGTPGTDGSDGAPGPPGSPAPEEPGGLLDDAVGGVCGTVAIPVACD